MPAGALFQGGYCNHQGNSNPDQPQLGTPRIGGFDAVLDHCCWHTRPLQPLLLRLQDILRRNLQRIYLRRLSYLAMSNWSAPEDCQSLAFAQLVSLEGRLQNVLKGNVKLDAYSRAHLEESSSRIRKVIEARLELPEP